MPKLFSFEREQVTRIVFSSLSFNKQFYGGNSPSLENESDAVGTRSMKYYLIRSCITFEISKGGTMDTAFKKGIFIQH